MLIESGEDSKLDDVRMCFYFTSQIRLELRPFYVTILLDFSAYETASWKTSGQTFLFYFHM